MHEKYKLSCLFAASRQNSLTLRVFFLPPVFGAQACNRNARFECVFRKFGAELGKVVVIRYFLLYVEYKRLKSWSLLIMPTGALGLSAQIDTHFNFVSVAVRGVL